MLLKPAHHLNDDTDSKFGHGILNQVYKMQSLLEEYQNSLTALEIEKADNQQEINKLEKRLKAKSENEGIFLFILLFFHFNKLFFILFSGCFFFERY